MTGTGLDARVAQRLPKLALPVPGGWWVLPADTPASHLFDLADRRGWDLRLQPLGTAKAAKDKAQAAKDKAKDKAKGKGKR